MNNPEHVLFSRKEAAVYIGVSLSTLDMIVARRLMRFRRIGKRVLIHRSELDRFARADHFTIWPKKNSDGKTTRVLESTGAGAA